MEEQIRVFQANAKKDKEELREEIKQTTIENINIILEEFQSLFGVVMVDKGNGASSGDNDEAENSVASLRGKGILPKPKENGNQPNRDLNGTGSTAETE
ncbi:hypothetical protein P3X46_034518, partial [Hevea brasiliensis]